MNFFKLLKNLHGERINVSLHIFHTPWEIFDCTRRLQASNYITLMHISCLLLLLCINPKTVQQCPYIEIIGYFLLSWGIVITNWCYKFHYKYINDSPIVCWFICNYFHIAIGISCKLIYDVNSLFFSDRNLMIGGGVIIEWIS